MLLALLATLAPAVVLLGMQYVLVSRPAQQQAKAALQSAAEQSSVATALAARNAEMEAEKVRLQGEALALQQKQTAEQRRGRRQRTVTILLARGDTVAADLPASGDYLTFASGTPRPATGMWVPIGTISGHGGKAVPAAIDRGAVERLLKSSSSSSALESKPITLGLVISGANQNTLLAQLALIETKLEQARHSVGPYGQSTAICLWDRPVGATDWVFYDVLDGLWVPIHVGLTDGMPYLMGSLRLDVLPYARPAPFTDPVSVALSSGGIAQGSYSWTYRKQVPGDVPALRTTKIADTSAGGVGHTINRLTLARRSLRTLLATDGTPLLALIPSGAGSAFADTGAIGGTTARASLTGGWQTLGYAVNPAGAAQSGLFDVVVRVRDAAAALSAPGIPTAASSTAVAEEAIIPRAEKIG